MLFSQMSPELWGREMREGDILSDQCAPGAATVPNAWAHSDCDIRHKGCMSVGFSALQKASAADKLVKANQEREAEPARLLEEVLASNPRSEEKAEGQTKEGWSFDKNGEKTYGPKTADKRRPVYLPDGSVYFV